MTRHVLTIVAVLVLGAAARAQSVPDISGYWIMDARSVKDLSGVSKDDQSLVIVIKGNTLTVKKAHGTWTYNLDGSQSANEPYGKSGNDDRFLGGTYRETSTVKLDRSTLTITSQGGAGEIGTSSVDVYTMRGAGPRRVLTVDRAVHTVSPTEFTSKTRVEYIIWP